MRKEFSKRTKRDAFARSGGKCEMEWSGERCNAKLWSGNTEYDHEIECARGGDNSLENCRVICVPCHKAKTKKNAPVVAKTKRQSDMSKGIKKTQSRPLPGTKASGWKRKMNGTWENR